MQHFLLRASYAFSSNLPNEMIYVCGIFSGKNSNIVKFGVLKPWENRKQISLILICLSDGRQDQGFNIGFCNKCFVIKTWTCIWTRLLMWLCLKSIVFTSVNSVVESIHFDPLTHSWMSCSFTWDFSQSDKDYTLVLTPHNCSYHG